MPSFILGEDAHAYYSATAATSTSNSSNVSSATEITNISDLTINLSAKQADITTRANNGWSQTAPSLKDGSVTFEMVWNTSDAAFTAMKNAFLNKTEIFFVALDQTKATSGSSGPSGNWTVVNFSRSEKLGEALKVSIELKPSSYTTWTGS